MNKKWLKRGGILGGFVIFVYFLVVLFLLDHAAEKRYLVDKKVTIENFVEHETIFNEIHKLSNRSPNFDLAISKTDSISLFLNYADIDFFGKNNSNDTLRIIIDTLLNEKNWIVKTNDSDLLLTQNYIKKYLTQFEKIYQLTKQVGCHRISNKEYGRLHIYFKTVESSGFRYTSFDFDLTEHPLDEFYIGEKLNENFYWNHFDNSMINLIRPHWIIPDSEFE